MRVPKTVLTAMIVLTVSAIAVTVIIVPYQMKLSHARYFANKQNELAQKELLKEENAEKVRALIQSNITEEQSENTDTEFTSYKFVVDEETRVCRIDVEIARGRHFERFSTKELRY